MSSRDWDLERTIARCEIQVYGRWMLWVVLMVSVIAILRVSL